MLLDIFLFDVYICTLLSLLISFDLKSNFLDIKIDLSACFLDTFAWDIFFFFTDFYPEVICIFDVQDGS